jgi:hypothetical protein
MMRGRVNTRHAFKLFAYAANCLRWSWDILFTYNVYLKSGAQSPKSRSSCSKYCTHDGDGRIHNNNGTNSSSSVLTQQLLSYIMHKDLDGPDVMHYDILYCIS